MIESMQHISNDSIAKSLDIGQVVTICQEVFCRMAENQGEVCSPKKLSMPLPGNGDQAMKWLNAMPAYIMTEGVAGIKWVNVCSTNQKYDMPTTSGLVVLNDLANGRPLALLDGTLITHYRTAATVTLAARLYAPRNSQVMTLIGPGEEGLYCSMFLLKYFNIKRINVLSRSKKSFENFKGVINKYCSNFININRINDLCESVAQSDIILSATTAMRPLLDESCFNLSCKQDQFICGLTAFNDIAPSLLNLVDNVVFDDGQCARARIEEVSNLDLNNTNISAVYSLSEGFPSKTINGINFYLPIGIAAMDIAIAFHYYKINNMLTP